MQNNWTMNIKENVMSHTSLTRDKFRSYKIQNGRQSAIKMLFFFIIWEILHDSTDSTRNSILLVNFSKMNRSFAWAFFRSASWDLYLP